MRLAALQQDVVIQRARAKRRKHLRQMRVNLAEPEPKLRERLQLIYDNFGSEFVKENVAPSSPLSSPASMPMP